MILSFEGLSLGFIFLHWSGLCVAAGIGFGALLSAYRAKTRIGDAEIIYYLFLPTIIWGAIGARLWFIFTPPLSSVQLGLTTQYYFSHPLDLLALWMGGYGIPGAWIGGLVALIFVARQHEIPFWSLADILAPGLALAQAIGRLGDYFNQELYGLPAPANLPWKMLIAPEYRLAGFESVAHYHPLFAYEYILNLANMFVLLWLGNRFAQKLKPGGLFLVYLMFYSAVRFLLEFLRLDVALINGMNVNQIFFAAAFFLAGIRLYWEHRTAPRLE